MCGSCDAQVAHRSADQFVEKSSESMRILRGDRKKRKSETLDEAAEAVPTLAKSKAGKSKSAKIATSSASSSKATSKKVTKKPAHGWADFRNGDEHTIVSGPLATQLSFEVRDAEPKRRKNRSLIFPDAPEFQPNLTPYQVISEGAFGGGYFRPIYSSIVESVLSNEHLEFDFFSTLSPSLLTNATYAAGTNKYQVKCGGSLQMWQSKGWISPLDPYGWFQWYCRFYHGRRSTDDERQIQRWKNCCGKKGRWKNNLITKVKRANTTPDDRGVSPVIRQTLHHWAFELLELK